MNIKRSLLLLLIAAAMLLPLLCACSVNTIEKTEDFAGKKLGIVTGTMFESVAREYYPEAELCFFNTSADLAEALNKDKIDAYMLDEPIGRIVVKPYPDQEISKVIEAASYAYAFAKDNERSDTLRQQMDAFIDECRKNGTLQEIDDIWFGDDDTRKTVTIDDLSDKNGTVRLATSTDIGEPFVYFKDGGLVGYEIDLLARFCREYGYGLEMTNYTFSAILAAIKSGKDDIAASTLAITEERKESVNFSSPTYDGGIVVVTKGTKKEEPAQDFADKKLGVVTGTMFDEAAKEFYPKAKITYFNSNNDMAAALDSGRIYAYMLDEPMARLAVLPFEDQSVSLPIKNESYAFAFEKDSKRSEKLRAELDGFIKEIKKNGVLDEIDSIWFGADESRKVLPYDKLTGENGTVRFAVASDVGGPFVYVKDGAFVGYEVDIIVRFCIEKGYDLKITDYNFSSLLSAVTSGKDDIAASAIAIKADREKIVDFSSPTYNGGIVVVTKSSETFAIGSLSNKKVGIPAASVFDTVLLKQVPDARCEYINAYADLSVALDTGKIDAYVADEPVARLMGKRYTDQSIVYKLEDASYGFMFPKGDKKHETLCDQMNALLAQYRKDGTLDLIDSIWFGDDESLRVVDMSDLSGENGVLEMVISTDVGAPFAYLKNGKMVGYDIDIAVRFCREYGYGLHLSDYNIAGLIAATSTGKADMSASSINITSERKETSLMSDPDYIGGIVVVIKTTKNYTPESFSNKKFGILTGSVFDTALLKQVPDAKLDYFNTYTDLASALDAGKIDAYVADQPVARLMTVRYPNHVTALMLEPASCSFMFPKGDDKHSALRNQMNEFLAKCQDEGTLDDIDLIWFGNDESRREIDISCLSGENGVLEMGVSTDVGAPFAYLQNGQMVGYDVDVAVRFCREYGYGLHITDYNFTGLLAAVASGKVDMAASSIYVTPERLETSLMSDPDYVGGIVIVTREDKDKDGDGNSFFASLRDSFERTFIREDRWKLFLSGLGTTFMITAISVIIGSLGGFFVYRIRRHKNKVFNAVWSFFASIMGRTPVVVILMILYYIIFGHSNLSSVWVSIIGFTLLFTCTVAELLEMGAGAVDGGQTEAALAMGYSERQTYLKIIFPQSIDHFLPAYKSEVISLVKATAVVGYIAVQDLTKVSDLIRARTYEAFFPLIATAIIYYLLTLALTRIISHINVLSDPRRRDAKKILHGIKTE